MNIKNNNKMHEITYDDAEINLKELFSVLWKSKLSIIVITIFFALASVLYALSLPNMYKSEAILNIDSGSNSNTSLGGLGGIATMVGINIPNSDGEKGKYAISTIKTRSFLQHLLAFEDVLPSLMAAKSYDDNSKKLIFDPEIYNENNKEWVRKPRKNQQSKPSYLETYPTYLFQVNVAQDPENQNFVTMSVEHLSPIFAKEFLELIIREANELLRNKDLSESSDAIKFLEAEIARASLVTMKDAINQLVQAQLEIQMMAKISPEYVLKIVEPPFIPEDKFSPIRSLICIIGTMIGGIFAILWVLIRFYLISPFWRSYSGFSALSKS